MLDARTTSALVVALSLLTLSSSPAMADRIGPGHQKSWGKEGISLEQYWLDSAECGHAAAEMNLEGTAPAKALVIATRMLENQWQSGSSLDAIRTASPEIQWNRAATIMRNALESCLAERGYVKFELTDDQYEMLRQLEVGSVDRRAYLHSLASDPDVLAAQAITDS